MLFDIPSEVLEIESKIPAKGFTTNPLTPYQDPFKNPRKPS